MRRTGGPHTPPPPGDDEPDNRPPSEYLLLDQDETVPIKMNADKAADKFGTYAAMFFFGCLGLIMFSCTVLVIVKIWKAIIP